MKETYNILTLFENTDKGFFVPSAEVFENNNDNHEAYYNFLNDIKNRHPEVLVYPQDSYDVMAAIDEIGVWGIEFSFDYNLNLTTGGLLVKLYGDDHDYGSELPKVHFKMLHNILDKLLLYMDLFKSKIKYGVKVYEKDLIEYFDIIKCEFCSIEDYGLTKGSDQYILFGPHGSEFPCKEIDRDKIFSFEEFKEMIIV